MFSSLPLSAAAQNDYKHVEFLLWSDSTLCKLLLRHNLTPYPMNHRTLTSDFQVCSVQFRVWLVSMLLSAAKLPSHLNLKVVADACCSLVRCWGWRKLWWGSWSLGPKSSWYSQSCWCIKTLACLRLTEWYVGCVDEMRGAVTQITGHGNWLS